MNIKIENVDAGYDGGHYGPKISQELANQIRGILYSSGLPISGI